MAQTTFIAEPGHWFLRGVQSAIFYYISFTPCLEFQHKRRRRKEAKAHNAQQQDVVTTQPGAVRQPGPFQTNETWAEELMLGPGPPKGWKGDKLLERLQKNVSRPAEGLDAASNSPEVQETTHPVASSLQPSRPSTETSMRSSSSETESMSSEDHAAGAPKPKSVSRPTSTERRLSNAVENIKDSLRTTLHPEKWNWKRYDREDEILGGFSERMTRMWNRATSGTHQEGTEEQQQQDGDLSTQRRKRAPTNESDRYDYRRSRHPEVNDLHPPVVSQLPPTRDEAAWMMLPPPSAAVMAGKKRPGAETEMRWPLAVIGSPKRYPAPEPVLAMTLSTEDVNYGGAGGDDKDNEEGDVSDMEYEDVTPSRTDELIEPPTPKRTKHLSEPIIKTPSLASASSLTEDSIALKRRDSWQIHYVIPSDRPLS
ncbi:hypothetical protein A1O3_09987 [Capronia epimyces CBS 606.96]|uniref:Uncharacterized protein n=1 Tax=Capronia epimyces CBS 606.96 TaxID=1182542 RepID=W9XBZ6_9EURO|nr:uncharacterized protein A1O3_09987 [Capronia epimyces CBS 606.96]EXJ77758.1 hypothetical protein A1O3_09987 [Capronia epimyces CBS 606.96]